MSRTASHKLAEQFEEWNIEDTIAQLSQKEYDEFQKHCSRLLELLRVK